MVRKASKLNQLRFSGDHDDLDGLKKDIAGAIKNIKEAANPAQQAAIAIAKKEKAGKPGYDKEGKSLKNKKESVMDAYREMWENGYITEEVADIKCISASEASRVAWHIGNRHVPMQILKNSELRILRDDVLIDMVRGLGASVALKNKKFQPEGGAYIKVTDHAH